LTNRPEIRDKARKQRAYIVTVTINGRFVPGAEVFTDYLTIMTESEHR
jgi:hypothetical protein